MFWLPKEVPDTKEILLRIMGDMMKKIKNNFNLDASIKHKESIDQYIINTRLYLSDLRDFMVGMRFEARDRIRAKEKAAARFEKW